MINFEPLTNEESYVIYQLLKLKNKAPENPAEKSEMDIEIYKKLNTVKSLIYRKHDNKFEDFINEMGLDDSIVKTVKKRIKKEETKSYVKRETRLEDMKKSNSSFQNNLENVVNDFLDEDEKEFLSSYGYTDKLGVSEIKGSNIMDELIVSGAINKEKYEGITQGQLQYAQSQIHNILNNNWVTEEEFEVLQVFSYYHSFPAWLVIYKLSSFDEYNSGEKIDELSEFIKNHFAPHKTYESWEEDNLVRDNYSETFDEYHKSFYKTLNNSIPTYSNLLQSFFLQSDSFTKIILLWDKSMENKVERTVYKALIDVLGELSLYFKSMGFFTKMEEFELFYKVRKETEVDRGDSVALKEFLEENEKYFFEFIDFIEKRIPEMPQEYRLNYYLKEYDKVMEEYKLEKEKHLDNPGLIELLNIQFGLQLTPIKQKIELEERYLKKHKDNLIKFDIMRNNKN